MFWDEVGKSSGRSCERRVDDVVSQSLAYFQGLLFDHLTRLGLALNDLNLEKIGKKNIIYCYHTWRCFLGKNVLQEVVGNSLSIT